MQKILRLMVVAVVASALCERTFGNDSNSFFSRSNSNPSTVSSTPSFSPAPFSSDPKPLRILDDPAVSTFGASDVSNASDVSRSNAPISSKNAAPTERVEPRVEPLVPLERENDADERTQALDEGDRLLAEGRWLDAKKRFEKALRSFPNDPTLRARFATARRRQEIELRYQDSTFVALTNRSNLSDVCAIFDEVFENIANYHVDRPSCETLFAFGLDGLAETLENESFYRRNEISLERRDEAREFFENIRKTSSSWNLRTSDDVRRAVLWIARQLRQKFGVPETATASEFLCLAVCSLDSYSAYLTPIQVDDVFSMIDGRFVGLGVELKTDDPARVVRVIPNSPALEAGVRAGDEIAAVDGKSTDGLSGSEVGALLQGASGTKAILTLRSPEKELRRVVAFRRQIDVPSVENVRILDAPGNVGYVKISCFQKTTATELTAAIVELEKKQMNGLVVDLRQNPGGLLQEAIDVSDLFLESGTIVQTRGRSGERAYSARRQRICSEPLVLLVDSNSASASEIFAGAMQENGRGRVVGTQSFGKGTVQAIVQLSCETRASKPIAGLRLTTEKFYSPKGFAYGGVGVLPDVRVPEGELADVDGLYAAASEEPQDRNADRSADSETTRRAAKPIVDQNGVATFVDNNDENRFAADDDATARRPNDVEADPFLKLAVREANRLIAAEKTPLPQTSNVAARRETPRFVGVSSGQF